MGDDGHRHSDHWRPSSYAWDPFRLESQRQEATVHRSEETLANSAFIGISSAWFLTCSCGANLNINRSAGDTWSFGDNYKNSNKVPNVVSTPDRTAQSFYYWYTDGSGKWLSTNTNTINPNLRDTLTGTTAVSTDKWTIQTLQYYAPLDEIDIQYGQKEYDNLQDALSDINNLNFVFIVSNLIPSTFAWVKCSTNQPLKDQI